MMLVNFIYKSTIFTHVLQQSAVFDFFHVCPRTTPIP